MRPNTIVMITTIIIIMGLQPAEAVGLGGGYSLYEWAVYFMGFTDWAWAYWRSLAGQYTALEWYEFFRSPEGSFAAREWAAWMFGLSQIPADIHSRL